MDARDPFPLALPGVRPAGTAYFGTRAPFLSNVPANDEPRAKKAPTSAISLQGNGTRTQKEEARTPISFGYPRSGSS